MRTRLIAILPIVFVLACGACNRNPEDAPQTPPAHWGIVEHFRPLDQQERQEALQRLFKAFQLGTPIDEVKNRPPRIDVQESDESFLGEGTKLRRWDWTAPPDDDKLHVELVFLDDSGKTVTYQRTYEVNRIKTGFAVRRAD